MSMESGLDAASLGAQNKHTKACIRCAQAKVKCIPNHDGTRKCERCHRLKKECQHPPPVQKRQINKVARATKTAQLEQKLDGIVSLLRSQSHSNASIVDSLNQSPGSILDGTSSQSDNSVHHTSGNIPNGKTTDPTNPDHAVGSTSKACSPEDARKNPPVLAGSCPYPGLGSTSSFEGSNSIEFSPVVEAAVTVEDEAFGIFRSQMLRTFPILAFPESMTVQHLRQNRPFLWLCIVAVSSKSTTQQVALGREVRRNIAHKLVLEGEKTLDLLEGLLVYVAWGQYHVHCKPLITVVLQLAIAILADLGLNKSPPKEPPGMMLEYDARGCPKILNLSPRTMEERRAAIACFSVSQTISSYFQRVDTLRWSQYLDECLQLLGRNKENPTDNLLVQIIRLQLITEKIAHGPWQDMTKETNSAMKIPTSFFIKAFQVEYDEFKRSIPDGLQQNETLLLHLHSANMTIHEIVLCKSLYSSNGPQFQRLSSLWTCLEAVKDWFEVFLSVSPIMYLGFPMSVYAHLAHCLVTLSRLSTFEHPEWDLGLAQQTCDMSIISGRVIKKFAQVKSVAGLDIGSSESNDMFTAIAKRVSAIKNWWDTKIAVEPVEPDSAAADTTLTEPLFDFSDDAWLRDMLAGGLGDYQFCQNAQDP